MAVAVEPIVRTVRVRVAPDVAFRVFTEGMGTWWPLDLHSIVASNELPTTVQAIVFEPRAGGRLYEVTADGHEYDWARVLEFEPPTRFVLAWKPTLEVRPPTELELRFDAAGDGTLVTLEHRGWERLGERAEQARAGYGEGWIGVLDLYRSAADRAVT